MVVIGVIATAILIPLGADHAVVPGQGLGAGRDVHTLYDVLLIASVPIFVVVETVVLFSVWKFRMRPGEEKKDGRRSTATRGWRSSGPRSRRS